MTAGPLRVTGPRRCHSAPPYTDFRYSPDSTAMVRVREFGEAGAAVIKEPP
jgi:hypothetical protein